MYLAELTENQFNFNPHLRVIRDRFPTAKVYLLNDEETIANLSIVINGRLLHTRTAEHLRNQGYAKSHLISLINMGLVTEAIVKPDNGLGMKLMVSAGLHPDGKYKLFEDNKYTDTYYNVWKLRSNLPENEECLFSSISKTLVEEALTINIL